jgi:hypothetical protein
VYSRNVLYHWTMAVSPSLIATVRDLATEGAPVALAEAPPATEFASSAEIADAESAAVATELRDGAQAITGAAYRWCRDGFASTTAAPGSGTITRLLLVSCPGEELMTSSRPIAPGAVVVGAGWPLESYHRLGSLLAHEAIHQVLFAREAGESPVREGSLAYSPWRAATRPGRLAWHAYWTFACQIALLVETMLADPAMTGREPQLPSFVSRLIPRLPIGLESLERFEVISAGELERTWAAMDALEEPVAHLVRELGLEASVESEAESARTELEAWARATARPPAEAAT